MLDSALKFVETPYHPNDRGNILLRFRERGFATLGNVFQPESVDAYREQLQTQVIEGKEWWNPLVMKTDDPIVVQPARAPRLLDVLRGAFMPWIAEQQPVLMSAGWLVRPSNPDEKLVHDWHKDGDHIGATSVQGYTFPQVVHTAIYLADMTPDMGPTYVIPRSHRDPKLSPFGGAAEEPFLPGKADVVIWDQRLWHRASARKVPGMRMVAIFAFYAVPIMDHRLRPNAAQEAAFKQASNERERILFGGPVEM